MQPHYVWQKKGRKGNYWWYYGPAPSADGDGRKDGDYNIDIAHSAIP
jgi:hypothetical protein